MNKENLWVFRSFRSLGFQIKEWGICTVVTMIRSGGTMLKCFLLLWGGMGRGGKVSALGGGVAGHLLPSRAAHPWPALGKYPRHQGLH